MSGLTKQCIKIFYQDYSLFRVVYQRKESFSCRITCFDYRSILTKKKIIEKMMSSYFLIRSQCFPSLILWNHRFASNKLHHLETHVSNKCFILMQSFYLQSTSQPDAEL
jgi:hypothetical protein